MGNFNEAGVKVNPGYCVGMVGKVQYHLSSRAAYVENMVFLRNAEREEKLSQDVA
jgi:hypothetical protein